MEGPMEIVLNRDLRTIKTRFQPEDNIGRCTSCTRMHHVASSFSSRFPVDTVFSGTPKNSSFYVKSYCHDQYSSKMKRLMMHYQTECGCAGVSEAKRSSWEKAWFSRFQGSVFFVSLCLFLSNFYYASAVPTTISSRSSLLNPDYSPHNSMNDKNFKPAFDSVNSAVIIAPGLVKKFKERFDADPEKVYAATPAYEWLPQVPSPESKEFDSHLSQLELNETVTDTYRRFKTILDCINQMEEEYQQDCSLAVVRDLRGFAGNIVQELESFLSSDDLQKVNESFEKMPANLKGLDRTNQNLRDWLIIRSFMNVLEYTSAVFKYFGLDRQ